MLSIQHNGALLSVLLWCRFPLSVPLLSNHSSSFQVFVWNNTAFVPHQQMKLKKSLGSVLVYIAYCCTTKYHLPSLVSPVPNS
ncbi:hypothetical protein A0J61_04537 [Choanephora cucurbitarum]|uniref:Uncharacterized protein n=1 Tax=Choanephora cucurbitarum TaxID=101091 RepID=A0A1C7NJD7_9FUNG|nr:hypothetical protein A0J61_04537 [Choanephora cucurbitarum]